MIRALLAEQLGGPEVAHLVRLPVRRAGPGEVRIAVHAVGLNFADNLVLAGVYQVRPKLPFTPGMEASGEVIEVGDGVRRVTKGDRVFGYARWGCLGEEVVLPAIDVFPLPAGMDWTTGAAYPISHCTALMALESRARLQPGETLLVTGAAGASGLAAVEVGKALGARVIAAASTAGKLDLARSRGADHLVNYEQGDLRDSVRAYTDGVDVVFETVGGDKFKAALRLVRWQGRILVVGFAGGDIPQIPANHVLVKNATIMGYTWSTYREHRRDQHEAAFARLARLWAEGKVRPHVGGVFALEETVDALRLLRDRKAMGKLVVKVR